MDRPNKPTALSKTPGLTPQAQVNITHSNSRVSAALPSGETVEILLFGAHIISWKDKAGKELLWMSEAAKLDGSKAVRGGVPLVFPVFGTDPAHASVSSLPQHGFARLSRWEFLGKSTSESSATTAAGDDSVKLDFGLSPNELSEESKEAWPHAFSLIYSVTLGKSSLTTTVVVRNEGEKTWDFQFLTHTYFKVKDISDVSVTGLESSSYLDKVTKPISTNTSPSGALTISTKTDRVYTPAKGPSAPVEIQEGGKTKISIVRDNMNQVVVWNPWKDDATSMADFAPNEGYKEMICVEAGAVNGWIELGPGDTYEVGQIITSSS